MLKWNPGNGWEHRAYWGEDLLPYGTNGTNSRRYMGPLPPAGGWVRLEVPASSVGVANSTLSGMSMSWHTGRAWFDRAGKLSTAGAETVWFDDALPTGATLISPSASSATWTDGGIACDFAFTGHYRHAKSGLHLALYRAYDAGLGRWLSRDPIAEDGGINLYGYCGGNPIINRDSLGLAWGTGRFCVDFTLFAYLGLRGALCLEMSFPSCSVCAILKLSPSAGSGALGMVGLGGGGTYMMNGSEPSSGDGEGWVGMEGGGGGGAKGSGSGSVQLRFGKDWKPAGVGAQGTFGVGGGVAWWISGVYEWKCCRPTAMESIRCVVEMARKTLGM
jgi:RHS repeat-associated protein